MSEILSFEDAKQLLLEKYQAITFLENLRAKHPELFDKIFLFQILIQECDEANMLVSPELFKRLEQAIDGPVLMGGVTPNRHRYFYSYKKFF